ncbi:MAG: helix-turn-helix domain-containing protein [Oscillospiraceae bacterium]|jgi:transcriptional regulator with XRE-family HTH domain|nr:helix-turn-helix domain-containing protein [Oscillospiraceae bacterium]
MTFGDKLKNARITLNLSQTELADRAGISERSIYAYEQTGAFPRRAVLQRLAEALNVTVAYLLDDEETDKHKNIDEELFLANVKNEYGYKGAREASEVLSRASALFAGGELEDNAKEIFFQSLMEVYLESKAEAREKFAPRQRVSRV